MTKLVAAVVGAVLAGWFAFFALSAWLRKEPVPKRLAKALELDAARCPQRDSDSLRATRVEASYRLYRSARTPIHVESLESVVAVLFASARAAKEDPASRTRLADLLFGSSDEQGLRDLARGRVARRGRLIVWYRRQLAPSVRARLLNALAAMPRTITS
jgi:hypothetical protein